MLEGIFQHLIRQPLLIERVSKVAIRAMPSISWLRPLLLSTATGNIVLDGSVASKKTMDPSSTARGRVGAFFSRVRRIFSTKADGDDSSNKATARAPDGTNGGIASCHSRFQYSSSARGAEFARGFSLPHVVAMPNADEDACQRPVQPARVVFLGAKSCGKTSLLH